MRNQMLMVLVAASFAVACGTENNAANSATNNTTANNTTSTTPNNTSANNTTNTTSPNNTTPPANNTTSTNPRTEPYITQFRYYVEDENALGTNREGFTLSVINGEIANEDGNSGRLTEADAEAFESTHLGDATIAKMQNGWGCRVVDSGGDMGAPADMGADAGDAGGTFVSEANYWFEARIQQDGSNREIVEITGCVLDNDPAVMVIIDALETLGASYL